MVGDSNFLREFYARVQVVPTLKAVPQTVCRAEGSQEKSGMHCFAPGGFAENLHLGIANKATLLKQT